MNIDNAVKCVVMLYKSWRFTKAVLDKCERIPVLAGLLESDIRALNEDIDLDDAIAQLESTAS